MLFVGWFWLFSPSIYITWCLRCMLSNGPWRWLIRICSLCNVVFPRTSLSVVGEAQMPFMAPFAYFFHFHRNIHWLRTASVLLSQRYLSYKQWDTCDTRQMWTAFPAVLTLFLFKGIYDGLPLGYLFIFCSMTTLPVMSLNISNITHLEIKLCTSFTTKDNYIIIKLSFSKIVGDEACYKLTCKVYRLFFQISSYSAWENQDS